MVVINTEKETTCTPSETKTQKSKPAAADSATAADDTAAAARCSVLLFDPLLMTYLLFPNRGKFDRSWAMQAKVDSTRSVGANQNSLC